MIGKEKVREINDNYDTKTYTLKEDLRLSTTEIWKKGTVVKIYIESTPSLVKLKFYPATETREGSVGRLAAYIINDDIQKGSFDEKDVDEWVATKFVPYVPKNKKSK
jgi:type II secretion system-associated lipoprotein